jgi:hypothetical protein
MANSAIYGVFDPDPEHTARRTLLQGRRDGDCFSLPARVVSQFASQRC